MICPIDKFVKALYNNITGRRRGIAENARDLRIGKPDFGRPAYRSSTQRDLTRSRGNDLPARSQHRPVCAELKSTPETAATRADRAHGEIMQPITPKQFLAMGHKSWYEIHWTSSREIPDGAYPVGYPDKMGKIVVFGYWILHVSEGEK